MSGEKLDLEMCKGVNGLDKVVLRAACGWSAEVYLYGGQVTSWKNNRGEELLFMSNEATFSPPKPIRGGIPICFPRFGSHGSQEQLGFARIKFWSIDPDPPPLETVTMNRTFVDLIFEPSEEDWRTWPHSFVIRLRVALGPSGELLLATRVWNVDEKPFSFTFAYHTYLSVSDISDVRVEGLETSDYLDHMKERERFTEQEDAITFESEVDRIYLSTPTRIAVLDHEKRRTFIMRKNGLPDAVVWNPWEEKVMSSRCCLPDACELFASLSSMLREGAWNPWDKKGKAMADFGTNEYKCMLCLGAAADEGITLKSGQQWMGKLELSAVPSSYCGD